MIRLCVCVCASKLAIFTRLQTDQSQSADSQRFTNLEGVGVRRDIVNFCCFVSSREAGRIYYLGVLYPLWCPLFPCT